MPSTPVAEEARRRTTSIVGRWRNQLGSTLELQVGPDDAVTGTFRAAVGTVHAERDYHVSGYALGNAVAFCVDFRPHGSVATWTGHHVEDGRGERLVTLWHLAQPVDEPHGGTELWRGVVAGADEFQRVA
jgi:hypothetical protein